MIELPLILVVEDDPKKNEFICASLMPRFRVASASDGVEGLQKVLELGPDLVLTDVMMPRMGGDELVRKIRSRPELATTPIVVLTAITDDPFVVRLLQDGADDALVQPFSVEELHARISNLVNARLATKKAFEANASLIAMNETLRESKASNEALLAAYERAERIAMRFQEAALPEALPEFPGFSLDAYYRAGPSDSVLGGDWYDALRLADGRVVVSIGDVGGNGLGAAIIMATIRQVIRGVAYIHPDPVMILGAAGKTLRAEHPDTYVTAFVGVIDPVAMTLAYASAGHPPPMLLDPGGTLQELHYEGMLLGISSPSGRSAEMVALSPGSLVVLYTDGLTEATGDIIASEAQLSQTVRNLDLSAAEGRVARTIHDRMLPAGARDDVAILTIEVLSSPFLSHTEPSGSERENGILRWTFDSADSVGAQRARCEFAAALRERDANEVDVFAAELVFGELVGNVVRHAHGAVEALVDWNGPAPVLHVLDRGPGFSFAPRLPDPLTETGRGLYIIAALTDDFNVTRTIGHGSHARAVISLTRHQLCYHDPAAVISAVS
jgi:serine phosphatase RsbU (regulator of sigma subunit)/anti-sigma regulatory factor (Ser/Thr protein kinase)